ncbi:uncharacterized protein TRIVIDRAFT_62230 [Trichoderma virens Gv29-8]|uniref:BAH domain-containing protein n=1 Tax=Hypocrea virens (strain Gv29-8 / FGSC 10586) TaxID=413071 RepID=G9MJ95_HYPVG|nr:uncharacterized protein TRIVIDRAFT_62230 [Trichoderma virens Gv29-8]EHK25558.1 hypothetical protein TRIVIDRAFT_62230 [Trichoderma virens Gv29-8]UKZ48621.1 hypothetical protein TrVGV298_002848 [Trichoderma virens]
MAPKHSLEGPQAEERRTKRLNGRSTPDLRSVTPPGIAFSVQYMSRDVKGRPLKKKKDPVHAELQVSTIRDQSADWGSMKSYKNFIIHGEVYKVLQYVYLRGEDTPKGSAARDKDFWIARILQVRASSPQHVYALIAWLYWPEELPRPRAKTSDTVNSITGQRKYHGSHELIAIVEITWQSFITVD